MSVDLEGLQLPAGTHAELLAGDFDGVTYEYVVVWADRPYRDCPLCAEPVDQVIEDCPAVLNMGAGAGGQLDSRNQQHRCGTWLAVRWVEVEASFVGGEVTEDHVLADARELAARLAADIEKRVFKIREGLRADLAETLRRLRAPLREGETRDERISEVSSGSEEQPGVYSDGVGGKEVWLAWQHHPTIEGETITVDEDDLDAPASAAPASGQVQS